MHRRQFLRGLGPAIFASGSIFRAAAQGRVPAHLGFIGGGSPAASADFLNEFRKGLANLGYDDPNTVRLDMLFAEGALDRIPALVADLEGRGVGVIVTHAQATVPTVRCRRTVPVIYEFSADPVSVGIAEELYRPLYNASGVTLLAAELNAKRLELLREIIPSGQRLAVVFNPLHPGEHLERAWISNRAQGLDFAVSYHPTPDRNALERTLALLTAEPPDSLLALSEGFIVQNRQPIIDCALQHRIPLISGWAVMADSGALLTYGPRLSESYRRTAAYVDRLLRGAKAADLPIERPSVLELVVNLETAGRLGLTMPTAILGGADRVIE
jgi:putative ABC transport system substrate-binding protein